MFIDNAKRNQDLGLCGGGKLGGEIQDTMQSIQSICAKFAADNTENERERESARERGSRADDCTQMMLAEFHKSEAAKSIVQHVAE